MTWTGRPPPDRQPLGPLDWLRVVRRGVPLAALVFGGLAILLALRLLEAPLFGARRPVTPWITRGVCRLALMLIGIGYRVEGRPMTGPGAVVANHASWLDIFALNASDCVYFVAKAEVAGWAGIGWLARATGTAFIRRDPRDAAAQAAMLAERLRAGHRLVLFPEGTSTDGQRILPFRPTLFAAFFMQNMPRGAQVQPVTLQYTAPPHRDARFYGWWGDMDFAPHLLTILAEIRQGGVRVTYHEPVDVSPFANRKGLAAAAERAVRDGFRPG